MRRLGHRWVFRPFTAALDVTWPLCGRLRNKIRADVAERLHERLCQHREDLLRGPPGVPRMRSESQQDFELLWDGDVRPLVRLLRSRKAVRISPSQNATPGALRRGAATLGRQRL